MWVIPTGKEHQPMLHDHGQQFGIDLTENAPGIAGLPVVEQAGLFPQLEKQLDLPACSQQGQNLLKAEQADRHIGQHDRPVRQFHHQRVDWLAMIVSIGADALLAQGGDLVGDALSQQAYATDQFAGSHCHQQFQSLSGDLGQDREQIQPLLVVPEHDADLVAHQEVDAALAQGAQPLQAPIAQVADPQAAGQDFLLAQDTVELMLASLLQVGSVQATFQQVPAHRNLEGGLCLVVFARFGRSSSTAAPDCLEYAGQTDATA